MGKAKNDAVTPDVEEQKVPADIEEIIKAEVARRIAKEFAERERKLAEEAEKAAAEAMAKKKEEEAASGPDPHELVDIMIGFDKQNIEPLYVRVNDYVREIPRGVHVQVPYFVAKHIEECAEQDKHRILMLHGLVENYEHKKRSLGIAD